MIGEYFSTIQVSIGEKFSNVIMTIAAFITGIGISFYYGPIFALICFAYYPIMMLIVVFFGSAVKKQTIAKVAMLKQMGGTVEESLSAIKLVTSFNQEQREADKFADLAEKTMIIVKKTEKMSSGMYGFFMLFMFGFYVYALWIGTQFIHEGKINPKTNTIYTAGSILTTMMALMMGMMLLMSLTPNI